MSIIDGLIEKFKREGIPVGVHCDTSKQDYSVRGATLRKKKLYQREYRRRTKEKNNWIKNNFKSCCHIRNCDGNLSLCKRQVTKPKI